MAGAIYNSYFDFRETPFSVTPDPRFFYTNTLYQEAFATLLYGIKNKKGFIVITGEVGTGKTTLLRKLMRQLEATIDSVFIFNTYLSFSELLQSILQDLGLPRKEKAKLAMIQQLNEYLLQQLHKGRTVSLLIDEAQNLTEESLEGLRLLSNLETDKEKLLQIVLMGQPELEAKLRKPSLRQLNQRVALRCRLSSLNKADGGSYIRHRLEVAGYSGSEIFSDAATKNVWAYSRGTPRLINLICDNALLLAYATSKRSVSAAMIDEVCRDLGLKKTDGDSDLANKAGQVNTGDTVFVGSGRVAPRVTRITVGAFSGAVVALLLAGVAAWIINPAQAREQLLILSRKMEIIGMRHGLKLFDRSISGGNPDRGKVQPPVEPKTDTERSKPANSEYQAPADKIQSVLSRIREDPPVEEQAPRGLLKPERKIENNWKDRPIVIEHGATIIGIANHRYGVNRLLAMDLLKEFNGHIQNLNWVIAGQSLWLPPLSRDTLLRKQQDGSYRVILASFPSPQDAERLSQMVRDQGYDVMVTPRRITDSILLHRVEIEKLKDLDSANQAWNIALTNTWVTFPRTPRPPGGNGNHSGIQDERVF